MAEPNPQNRLNPEQYARLKAEIAAPYRSIRKFIYIACAASGSIGAFIFFFKLLAGRDIEHTLPNLALQLGIVAIMIFFWGRDQNKNV
ncbi:DUF3493 domain-containing protein [Fortiea contorta]|uniref:DUF3493 domain-containing protein n=1 Tax=Fortiea contorta TaxID=1892405 RepID=UPI000348612B|nr:DUF3493 domain-containing protein [Fortiea contorta]